MAQPSEERRGAARARHQHAAVARRPPPPPAAAAVALFVPRAAIAIGASAVRERPCAPIASRCRYSLIAGVAVTRRRRKWTGNFLTVLHTATQQSLILHSVFLDSRSN